MTNEKSLQSKQLGLTGHQTTSIHSILETMEETLLSEGGRESFTVKKVPMGIFWRDTGRQLTRGKQCLDGKKELELLPAGSPLDTTKSV